MNEAQLAALIANLAASIPADLALYRTITENRAGTKTVEELVADSESQYDAIIAAAKKELGTS